MLKSSRLHNTADRCRDVVEDMQRLPAYFRYSFDRLCREFWGRNIEEDVRAGRLQRDDLRVDGRVSRLITLFADDHGTRLGAKTKPQSQDVIPPVIVVLVHEGDLGVGQLLQHIRRVYTSFGLIAGLPAHRPREMLRIIPLRCSGGDKKLRYLPFIHVSVNSAGRGRTEL